MNQKTETQKNAAVKTITVVAITASNTHEAKSDGHNHLKTLISSPHSAAGTAAKSWPLHPLFSNLMQVCLINRTHFSSKTLASKEYEKLVFHSKVPWHSKFHRKR